MTVRGALIAGAIVGTIAAISAAPAYAQKEQFIAGVRDLSSAAASNDAPRIQAAADRMATGLAQWDRTISAIETRIARDLDGPRAYELHLELAVIYLERGRLTDAIRHLEQASAAQPAAPDAHVMHAAALELAGKTDAAFRQWQTVWGLDRNNPVKAYQVLRTGDKASTDRPAAAAAVRAAYERLLTSDEPPRPLAFGVIDIIPDTFSAAPIIGDRATAEGFALIAEARYDDALAALRRESQPGDAPLVRFARAREYEQTNRVREARREYEAAVAGTLSGRSLLYMGIGRLAQVEGDFAGAIEAFTRAVRLNPNDVNMHRELAFAYAGQGAVDDAFNELVAALLLNPRDAQAFADIGRLLLDAGRDADALPPLYRALTLAPDRFEARYAIATGLTRLGRNDDAARELAAFQRAQRDALDRQRKGLESPGSPR